MRNCRLRTTQISPQTAFEISASLREYKLLNATLSIKSAAGNGKRNRKRPRNRKAVGELCDSYGLLPGLHAYCSREPGHQGDFPSHLEHGAYGMQGHCTFGEHQLWIWLDTRTRMGISWISLVEPRKSQPYKRPISQRFCATWHKIFAKWAYKFTRPNTTIPKSSTYKCPSWSHPSRPLLLM